MSQEQLQKAMQELELYKNELKLLNDAEHPEKAAVAIIAFIQSQKEPLTSGVCSVCALILDNRR